MYGPIIEGRLVRLEPPSAELAPLYCRWLADPDVNLYTLRFPPSPKMAEGWLEKAATSDTDVLWMLTVEGRPLGASQIDTINWHHRRGDIAFTIDEKAAWGKGYATEAVRLMTRFASDELNLEKLCGEAIADNVGSIRAMEKAGYAQYGRVRKHFYQNGHWSDTWFGELLREEWDRAE